MTGVQYPDVYEDFLSALDVVNLNIGFIVSLACVVPTDFYDRLLMATLGPVVALGLLYLLYAIAERRNRHSSVARGAVKRKFLSIAVFVVFLVYSTVSHTIFQTFDCDEDVGYLRADYSLECATSEHRFFMGYAGAMVIVYPIGVPATFSWWLFRNREALARGPQHSDVPGEITALQDIWEPYKSRYFYYEIVEYARRIILTGLAVFIYPGTSAQIAIVLILALLFALVSEVISPFRRSADAWLYRAGNCTTYLSMYLALLLKLDVSDEGSRSQAVYAGLLIAAHVGLMLAIASQCILGLAEHRLSRSGRVGPPCVADACPERGNSA